MNRNHANGVLTPTSQSSQATLFLSYGRKDAAPLADRLCQDLRAAGYEVWQDTRRIRSGNEWEREIEDGLRSAQVLIALLSPHAVRLIRDRDNPDEMDSVCLDEISFARFSRPPTPIVPVMAQRCEPPFCIFRLDYVDLTTWNQSNEQYRSGFERLLVGIESAVKGEVRNCSWMARLKPLEVFDAHLNEKRQNFCGRDWLFDEIDAWRHSHSERALLITGDPGVGKSAIVAQLVHLNPHGQLLAYHCCMADTPETLRPGRFVQSLAAMIGSRLNDYAAMLETPELQERLSDGWCSDDPFSALEQGVLAPLERLPAPAEGVRYILLDALDESLAVAKEGATIVDLLATRLDRLPGWLRIVATTRKDPDVLRRLSGLRAHTINAHDPRNLEDIDTYIAHRLQTPNLAERLAASRIDAAGASRRLREAAEGNFLYVKQALDDIERDNYALDHLEELPRGLTGLYQQFFARRFGANPDPQTYGPTRRVLEVVVAAREPLTWNQLQEASGLDGEYELPDVLRRLAVFVPQRDERYSLYHKSLVDWLVDRENPFRASEKRGHQRLAECGLDEFRRQGDKLSEYHLRHLPQHLMRAEMWDQLAELLVDLHYLETKTEAGFVFALAGDFSAAAESIPDDHPQKEAVILLEEAFKSEIHFVARRPTALFDCLWNRGAWSGLSGLLSAWRKEREARLPDRCWLRSLRPPATMLGGAQKALFRGHAGGVWCVAVSPDGAKIASASSDKSIRIWDRTTGIQLKCLEGHWLRATSVAFSPDGSTAASGSYDQTVRMWDVQTGDQIACFISHQKEVSSVTFSPNGEQVVSGCWDGTIRVWDVRGRIELNCLQVRRRVTAVAFSPNGRWLASADRTGAVRVWDAATHEEVVQLIGHQDAVQDLAWSHDGEWLVSASRDHLAIVWDVSVGRRLSVLKGHRESIESVTFAEDSKRIITASRDGTIRHWNAATGAETQRWTGGRDPVRSIAVTADGRWLVSGADDAAVRLWDMRTKRRGRDDRDDSPTNVQTHLHAEDEAEVLCLAFSPDGSRLASGDRDGVLTVWNVEDGAKARQFVAHGEPLTRVVFTPGGDLLASSARDKQIALWCARSGKLFYRLEEHSATVGFLAFSQDGTRALSRSDDRAVRIWQTGDGQLLGRWDELEGPTNSIAFHPDGRRFLTGGYDGSVNVWELSGGALPQTLAAQRDAVRGVAVSADGRLAVSGAEDGTICVWDLEAGELHSRFDSHPHRIQGVAFTEEGDVMSATADQSFIVWSLDDGKRRFEIPTPVNAWVICRWRPGQTHRILAHDGETTLESLPHCQPLAWFPVELNRLTPHPRQPLLAGVAAGRLYLIGVEGEF